MNTQEGTSTQGFDVDAMLRFAEHVRDTPQVTASDAETLAKRFGLPEHIVRESLLLAADAGPRAADKGAEGRRSFGELAAAAFSYTGRAIYRHPLVATAIGSLAFFGFFRYFDDYAGASEEAWALTSLLSGFGFLLAVNLIRGQFRYAVISSPVAVAAALASSYVVDVVYGKTVIRAEKVSGIFMNSLALMPLLAGFLSFGAVFGALWRIRRQAIAEQRQDRLQLLQRVFDLQEKLAGNAAQERQDQRLRTFLRLVRRQWPLTASLVGLGLGAVYVLMVVLFGLPERNPSFLQQIVYVFELILNMSVYPALGFVAGSWLRGFAAGLIAFIAFHLMLLLPVEGLGLQQILGVYLDPKMMAVNIANALILLLMSTLGGIGAAIDDKNERHKRIAAEDQAAVLSEIIRVQKLLETGESVVCVMVADCVHSTRMKQGADPLAVEISFREFHEFLADEVRRAGGAVLSTAGDSAMAEFSSADRAFAAARSIQTRLPDLNRTANRLNQPFRVRIGLHCGSVHGGLEKVMFTNVIDVAAHIEKSAPAGGIVVTREFAAKLADGEFAKLADAVDGHEVLLALNPTLD
jgi:class 3 adenylate cyclase